MDTARQGGGYQYRLCPASEELTEACFQQHVLPFVGKTQKLRWVNGKEVEINATRVSEGTFPVGSVWTKNPIPACVDKRGGRLGVGCPETQFEPPPGCDETCFGYQPCVPWVHGTHWQPKSCSEYPGWKTREIPSIVDNVVVPADLQAGEYVFQWRWDSEQTAQASGMAPTAHSRHHLATPAQRPSWMPYPGSFSPLPRVSAHVTKRLVDRSAFAWTAGVELVWRRHDLVRSRDTSQAGWPLESARAASGLKPRCKASTF